MTHFLPVGDKDIDLGRAQVHAGDNSRLNALSFVTAEAYKKEKHSRKHTSPTRKYTHRQYARIQTNLLLLLHEIWRNQNSVYYISVHAYIGC